MSDRSSLAPLDRVCAFLPKLPKSYAARGSCSTSSCPSRLAKRFLRLNHPEVIGVNLYRPFLHKKSKRRRLATPFAFPVRR